MTGPRDMGPIDVWLYSMYRANLRTRQHTRQGEPLTVPERTFSSVPLRVWCWWVQRKTANSKEPEGSFLVDESGDMDETVLQEEIS